MSAAPAHHAPAPPPDSRKPPPMPHYQHVIFDLDGTLIDSAPAILASFRAAFAAAGREPAVAIDESIIGPPLAETLAHLSGTSEPAVIADLAQRFAAVYDTTGLLETAAYPGVGEMLRDLSARGQRLHIATNKRIHPTRKILAHLGWDGFFDNVYALDLFTPRLPDKAAMIARLLADRAIAAGSAVYVGDREEDGLSADANGLPFLAATWGYGSLPARALRAGWTAVDEPSALLDTDHRAAADRVK